MKNQEGLFLSTLNVITGIVLVIFFIGLFVGSVTFRYSMIAIVVSIGLIVLFAKWYGYNKQKIIYTDEDGNKIVATRKEIRDGKK